MHRDGIKKIRVDRFICLLLIVSAFSVYGRGINHEFIDVYDDKQYIIENSHVKNGLTVEGLTWAFTATYASNWHPLTWLSHMMDCRLFGMNPGAHHIPNVLFHTFNVLLLFIVLKRMTGYLWRSAFVAALFSLHPLHVESVAWVAERKDVLSAFFWMLTLWSYSWYLERPSANRYLLLLLFFVFGLLAKPMLVTLPFVLLLLDYWPLNRLRFEQLGTKGNGWKPSHALALVWEKLPLFAIAAASCVVTLIAQKSGGAVGSLEEFPVSIRIANALVSYMTYLGKMAWPGHLAVFYPHPKVLPSWHVLGATLLLLFIFFVTLKTMKQRPYLAVGWLWYVGTLVPVIGLVQVGDQAMADRYTYIPLIGIFIAVSWGVSELLGSWRHGKIALGAIGTAVLSSLLAVTWVQVGYWKNSITLFQHALDVTADNPMAHNNLGFAFDNLGRRDVAFYHWSEAVRIKPDFPEAHYNLGTYLQDQGQIKDAVRHYREALRIRPEFPQARHNLAKALERQGNIEEAVSHYQEALKIDPSHVEARNNLGLALERQGKFKEAIIHYSEALRMRPDHAASHNNLGNALLKQGNLSEAVHHYRAALRGRTKFPETYNNLGMALARNGDLEEAIMNYTEAIRLKPDFAEAHNNLGNALSSQGNQKEAARHFSEAVRINPDHAQAHFNLGNTLCKQGDFKTAIAHYTEAIRIRPEYSQAHYNLGNTLYGQGDFKAAIRHYSEAIRLRPDYAQAHYNLGIALESQGNLNEAIKHFSEALKIRPDFPQAQKRLELISEP